MTLFSPCDKIIRGNFPKIIQRYTKMTKIRLLCLLLGILMLLSSCSSVYVTLPEPTSDPNVTNPVTVEEGDEYYTSGKAKNYGNMQYGFLFGNYWMYREIQYYKELVDTSPNGEKIYNTKLATRLVKVNTGTGSVSSLCLDPVCNHSPGSGCAFLTTEKQQIHISSVAGNWIVVEKAVKDSVYGMVYETFAYNPISGERHDILVNEYGETSVTKWIGKAVFENRLYSIRMHMDYSNTDYVPGGDKPMSDFEPETVNILCYYDFETQSSVDLFELPDGYRTSAVTNKRFFFKTPEGDFVSCGYDGKNMVKEDVIDFSPENSIGTFAYLIENTGFELYDLKTNTKTSFELPFTAYQYPTFTNSGIIYDTFTSIDEWGGMSKGYSQFAKDHPEMKPDEARVAYDKLMNAVKYSGKAQIWRSDFKGENLELIFEKENAVIHTICGNDSYVFGFAFLGDPKDGFKEIPYENDGRSMINLATGEITPVPYLDLIDDYDIHGD